MDSKNHARAMESMQASFEAEARAKVEALKSKKKLEQDIVELESAVDNANRGRAEADKVIKKLQQQVKDVEAVRCYNNNFYNNNTRHLTLNLHRRDSTTLDRIPCTSYLSRFTACSSVTWWLGRWTCDQQVAGSTSGRRIAV